MPKKTKSGKVIKSKIEPENWFRFEEPYQSSEEGPSYVSVEDVREILKNSDLAATKEISFYRLRGKPDNYALIHVMDSSLVKKLTKHRKELVAAQGYDEFISSTGPGSLGMRLSDYTPGV